MESDDADPAKDYRVEVKLRKMVKEQYGKVPQTEFLQMEKQLSDFKVARKGMLLLYKDHGWSRKKSCSRDKSIDTVVSKKIVIEPKASKARQTRRTYKILNESKNGFDLIKV